MESFEGSGEQIKPSRNQQFLSREDIPVGAQVVGPCLVADDFGTLWIEDGWRATKGDRGSLLLEFVETDVRRKRISRGCEAGIVCQPVLLFGGGNGCPVGTHCTLGKCSGTAGLFLCLARWQGISGGECPSCSGALGCSRGMCPENYRDHARVQAGRYCGEQPSSLWWFAPARCYRTCPGICRRFRPSCCLSGQPCPSCRDWRGIAWIHACIHQLFGRGGSGHFSSVALRGWGIKMDEIEKLLGAVNYPSRQVAENLADLSAQVASLRLGMDAMQELLKEYGADEISLRMAEMGKESAGFLYGIFEEFGRLRTTGGTISGRWGSIIA